MTAIKMERSNGWKRPKYTEYRIYSIYVYINKVGETKGEKGGLFALTFAYSARENREGENLKVYSGISLESCNHVVKPLICNDITAALTVGESYCTNQETQETEQGPDYLH